MKKKRSNVEVTMSQHHAHGRRISALEKTVREQSRQIAGLIAAGAEKPKPVYPPNSTGPGLEGGTNRG